MEGHEEKVHDSDNNFVVDLLRGRRIRCIFIVSKERDMCNNLKQKDYERSI